MAGQNWVLPENDTIYTSVLQILRERDEDTAMGHSTDAGVTLGTNLPEGTIKFNRSSEKWEILAGGGTWADLVTKYSIDVDKLDGQHGSYYQNASNIISGTIGNSYLPSSIGVLASSTFQGVSFTGHILNDTGTTVVDVGTGASPGSATFLGALTGNADSATIATTATNSLGVQNTNATAVQVLTVGSNANGTDATFTGRASYIYCTANDSNNETVYPLFVDGKTGTQGAETDTGFTYNPSAGKLSMLEMQSDNINIQGNTISTTDTDGNLKLAPNGTGDVEIYQEAQAPVLLTLHNYHSDILGAGNSQGNFIDFKMTDDNETFTPQARIGMIVNDSDGDGGKISEGTGNFVVYTGEGTDQAGNGTLTEHFRVTDKGKVGIGTDSPTTKLTVSTSGVDGIEISEDTGTAGNSGRLLFTNDTPAEGIAMLNSSGQFSIRTGATPGVTSGTTRLLVNTTGIKVTGKISIGAQEVISSTGTINTARLSSVPAEWNKAYTGGTGLTESSGTINLDADHRFADTVTVTTGNQHEYIEFNNAGKLEFNANNKKSMTLSSTGNLDVRGDITAYASSITSDKNLKTAISTVSDALTKVSQLNGVEFTFKGTGKRSAGIIAQDVEKVLPQAVTERELPLQYDDGVKYKTVDYNALHSLYIEAIKELKDIVEGQALEIEKLKG